MLQRPIPHKGNRSIVGWKGGVASDRRFNETVPDVVSLENRQAREHREIVHVGRAHPQPANHQSVLRVGRTVDKPFEIDGASRVADLCGIHLLQRQRTSALSRSSCGHGCPLFEGGPSRPWIVSSAAPSLQGATSSRF